MRQTATVEQQKLAETHFVESIPLNESRAGYADLVNYTYENFLATLAFLQRVNTPPKILEFLLTETEELFTALVEQKQWIDIVAEVGDLFHFFHDLCILTQVSVPALLEWFDIEAEATEHATIEEYKKIIVSENLQTIEPLQTLQQLKECLRLTIKSGQIDELAVASIGQYIFALAVSLNINVVYAVMMKNKRNKGKYDKNVLDSAQLPDIVFESGSTSVDDEYDRMKAKLIEYWVKKGGDETFFEQWLVEFPIELSVAERRRLAVGTVSGYQVNSWVKVA